MDRQPKPRFWRPVLAVVIALMVSLALCAEATSGYEENSPQVGATTGERYRGPLPPPPRVENLKSTQRAAQSQAAVPPQTGDRPSHLSQPSLLTPPARPLLPNLSDRQPRVLSEQPSPAREELAKPIVALETDRIDVKLEVSGKVGDPKSGTANLKLEANLAYEEQIIQSGEAGSVPIQAIRLYDKAEANIWLGDSTIHPKLRDDRRYIGVYCGEEQTDLFCPDGPLTRDELDLLDVLGNSAVIDLLLPKAPVRQGSEWQVSDEILRRFLGLDSITENTVACRVTEILSGGIVRVEMSGKLRGLVLGATTQSEILGRFQFALTKRKITWLAMIMRENRGASFVDYPFEVTSRLQLTRTPVSDSKLTSQRAGSSITFPPLPEHLKLVHRDESKGWQLSYDRKWYLVSSSSDLTVFRMVDRQGQVAQCNVALLPAEEAKLTLAGLRDNVQQVLGENFGRIVDANELRSPTGHQMFHVHVIGQVSDVPIHWIYYVMTTPDGKNYAAAFTVEEKTLERFANGDREFVDGFEFLQAAEETRISRTKNADIR